MGSVSDGGLSDVGVRAMGVRAMGLRVMGVRAMGVREMEHARWRRARLTIGGRGGGDLQYHEETMNLAGVGGGLPDGWMRA